MPLTQKENEIEEALNEAVPAVKDPSELPEAPASATVHAWNTDNFGVLFTIRDQDAKLLYGRVTNFLKVLKNDGWKPDWKDGSTSVQKAVVGQPTTPGAPVCGVHGTPMEWKTGTSKKTGKPYAFWSCGQKNADGSWCNWKPEK